MNRQHERKDISQAASKAYKEAVTRYRRFMALRGSQNDLVKQIEFLDLSPGCSFRTVTDNGGTKYKSSKGDIAECYAVGKYFRPNSLKALEEKLGSTWKDKSWSDDGLW